MKLLDALNEDNVISYQGVAITKLIPSGYYEIYSDVEGRFLKFDSLIDAKEHIDSELELEPEEPNNDATEYNRDLALRIRDGQVGSGMSHRP